MSTPPPLITPNPVPRVSIDGKEYTLKMTFAACDQVERQIDSGFQVLLGRIARKDFRVGDVASVIHEAIIGGGVRDYEAPTRERIGEMLLTEPKQFYTAFVQLVLAVATAGRAQLPSQETKAGEAPAT